MKKVFRIGDTEPFEVLPSGHTAWLLAKVGNLTANILESKKLAELPSPCHQEEEQIHSCLPPDSQCKCQCEQENNQEICEHPDYCF